MGICSAQLQFLRDVNWFQSTYKRSSVVVAPVTHHVKIFDVVAKKQE